MRSFLVLEFIVLGRIPGTNFQITFWWYLVVVLVSLLLVEKKLHTIYKNQFKQDSVYTTMEFSYLGQVKDFVRIIEVLRERIVFAWKSYLLKIIQLLF